MSQKYIHTFILIVFDCSNIVIYFEHTVCIRSVSQIDFFFTLNENHNSPLSLTNSLSFSFSLSHSVPPSFSLSLSVSIFLYLFHYL